MKLLNIETPVTRNFTPQILLNVQDFTSIRLATQVMTKASSDLRQTIMAKPGFMSMNIPTTPPPDSSGGLPQRSGRQVESYLYPMALLSLKNLDLPVGS
jgi:hypothetical protein